MRSVILFFMAVIALAMIPAPLFATYDHVVVVMLENHSYQQILDSPSASYINTVLRPESANITQSYGVQHPSQPNYYWLFSGSNQGITTDTAPTAPVYSTPNLYTSLTAAGQSFGGYVDAYPGPTNLYSDTDNYVTRHVPWLGFTNVPANLTQPFTSFPTSGVGYAALPTVSFVIPGLDHDMHDYNSTGSEVENSAESEIAIGLGDAWLRANIDSYVEWAKANNSLLILTTDEDSTADWITPPLTVKNADDYTSPDDGPNPSGVSGPNQITTLFVGANIVAGDYSEGNGTTNVNVLRTIESFYGLTPSGDQAPLATAAGIGDGPITDIFAVPVPEPSSITLLLLSGVFCVLFLRKQSFKSC
ncbi:MAG: alkaline phosphatase family protein [Chthoniobacterales bacterium]